MKPDAVNIPPNATDVNARPGAALTDRPRRYVFIEDVANYLNARGPSSSGWYSSRCPVHDDRSPSFRFTDNGGEFGFYCHAECKPHEIIAALKAARLWPVEVAPPQDRPKGETANTKTPDAAQRKFDAELISAETGPVKWYLRARGIDITTLSDIAQHRQAWHQPSGRYWPCMVAGVRDVEGKMRSLHRTYLSYSDPPTKAPIDPPRMLWPGPSTRGCAIRLAPAFPKMLIAEGIETTASAMKIFGLPGWSAISATGLRNIELPAHIRDVTICADNDKAGIEAAEAAMRRLTAEGRDVRIKNPTDVKDFNDLLLMRRKP
jgi:putative DNA primase/helicase